MQVVEQLAQTCVVSCQRRLQTLGPDAQVPIPAIGNPHQHHMSTGFDLDELQGTPTQRCKIAVTRIINHLKEELGKHVQNRWPSSL